MTNHNARLIIDVTVREALDAEPILTVQLRRALLDGESLEAFCERFAEEACRELHAPKIEWRTA